MSSYQPPWHIRFLCEWPILGTFWILDRWLTGVSDDECMSFHAWQQARANRLLAEQKAVEVRRVAKREMKR